MNNLWKKQTIDYAIQPNKRKGERIPIEYGVISSWNTQDRYTCGSTGQQIERKCHAQILPVVRLRTKGSRHVPPPPTDLIHWNLGCSNNEQQNMRFRISAHVPSLPFLLFSLSVHLLPLPFISFLKFHS